MESSWRFNVFDFGLQDWGIRLAARLLTDATLGVIKWDAAPTGFYFRIRKDPSSGHWGPYTMHAKIPGVDNFPYGEIVLPD